MTMQQNQTDETCIRLLIGIDCDAHGRQSRVWWAYRGSCIPLHHSSDNLNTIRPFNAVGPSVKFPWICGKAALSLETYAAHCKKDTGIPESIHVSDKKEERRSMTHISIFALLVVPTAPIQFIILCKQNNHDVSRLHHMDQSDYMRRLTLYILCAHRVRDAPCLYRVEPKELGRERLRAEPNYLPLVERTGMRNVHKHLRAAKTRPNPIRHRSVVRLRLVRCFVHPLWVPVVIEDGIGRQAFPAGMLVDKPMLPLISPSANRPTTQRTNFSRTSIWQRTLQ